MRKVGIILCAGSLVWLAGMMEATAGGHADINAVFTSSSHSDNSDNCERWDTRPERPSGTTRFGTRTDPEDAARLYAQAAPPANKDESEDEWADEDDWEDEEGVADEIPDPLMAWNWMWFQFNDKFYLYLWEPLAEGYGYVVPEGGRRGVRNFFTNLTTPIRLVNCLLQGKWDDAGNETARFLINTTMGVLGFGDPARKEYGPPKDEDFGQTLGYWGLNDGFFLTWPFIGPSSLRDTIGFVADGYLHPVSYIDGDPTKTTPTKIAIKAYEKFNTTSFQIGEYEKLKRMALDPYVAIRNMYFQNRQKKIAE
ncbi:MAG: VacJ family lipoprotein [Desulfosarcina sp.]|nr:VacJ family lipoprotein [Desulfobacterales bacterium]